MRWPIAVGLSMFVALAAMGAHGIRTMQAPAAALSRPVGDVEIDPAGAVWLARYEPAEDRPRLVAQLDRTHDVAVEPTTLDDGADGIALQLPALSPGLHFLELSLHRRGGRSQRITDEVLVGPWQSQRPRGCDLALTLRPEGLQQVLLPVIEAKILAGARTNEFFGPTSTLRRSTLTVVDGGLRFEVFLDTDEEDKGDLAVAGVVDVRGQGDAGIVASLRRLEVAAPGPKLEALAKAEGRRRLGALGVAVGGGLVSVAGGGVLLGVAAAAGGGLIAGGIGEEIGKQTARREVRREAVEQIERALAEASDALRLPEDVVVLPTEPALRADLRWCDPPSLDHGAGLRARMAVVLRDDAISRIAAARTVMLDARLPAPREPTEPDANLHVDVSADFLNRILAEWVVRGGLQQRLDASGLRGEVQAELGERTRWEVVALGVDRPPIVWPRADGRIDTTLGGVTVELHDPDRAGARTVVLGATGSLQLVPLVEPGLPPGRVRLGGTLDAVYFGCRAQGPAREQRLPCFSGAVDPPVLRDRLDQQLRTRSDRLPVLDLGSLVRLQAFESERPRPLSIEALWVRTGEGIVALDAAVR